MLLESTSLRSIEQSLTRSGSLQRVERAGADGGRVGRRLATTLVARVVVVSACVLDAQGKAPGPARMLRGRARHFFETSELFGLFVQAGQRCGGREDGIQQ